MKTHIDNRYYTLRSRTSRPARLALLLLLTTLFALPHALTAESTTPSSLNSSVIQSLISTSKIYLGKPYQFRNVEGNIMDCSGFLQYVFKLNQITLPRTSREMATSSRKLDYQDAKPGDLLFFKAWNKSSREVAHVSMVIANDNGILQMIHSSARGVVIDEFPTRESYKNRYLFAGRVPALEGILAAYPAAPASGGEATQTASTQSAPSSPVN